MSNNKADIDQVRKYLQGELNARDQHQLERAALDDPFLQDAMDGYAQHPVNQQANLDALDALLSKRVNQAKVHRLGLWPYLAAAAVVVALTIAYLLWPAGNESPVQVAATPKTQLPPQTPIVADTAVTPALQVEKNALAINKRLLPKSTLKQQEVQIDQAVGNSDVKQVAEADKDETKAYSLNEVATTAQQPVNSYAKSNMPRLDTARKNYGYAGLLKPADTMPLKEITLAGRVAKQKPAPSSAPQVLLNKVEGVQVTTPDRRISGVIYDELGHPLPGVSVRVKETQQAAQTDANGKFSIAANSAKTLNIGFVGYLSRQVIANPNDSVNVALEPSQSSLNEVVVIGYGNGRIKQDKNPHPRSGWDNYNRYLQERAFTTTEIPKGTVKLSFTVNPDGSLANLKVISSLTPAADKQAMEMIKNGPGWLPAANQKPKTITLKIRFKKQ